MSHVTSHAALPLFLEDGRVLQKTISCYHQCCHLRIFCSSLDFNSEYTDLFTASFQLGEHLGFSMEEGSPHHRIQPLCLMTSHLYPSMVFMGMQPGPSHRYPCLVEPWLWFNALSWNSSQFWNKDPTYSFLLTSANYVASAKNSFTAVTKRPSGAGQGFLERAKQ